jgi:sugar/nucleoside kinase (ribokinase family)
LWDPPEPRAAMRRAIESRARTAAGSRSLTCADFCVHMHGKDFRKLIDDGLIDILLANEEEAGILEGSDFDAAIESLARDVPLLVVTRAERGAVAIRGASARRSRPSRSTAWSTRPAGSMSWISGSCTSTMPRPRWLWR